MFRHFKFIIGRQPPSFFSTKKKLLKNHLRANYTWLLHLYSGFLVSLKLLTISLLDSSLIFEKGYVETVFWKILNPPKINRIFSPVSIFSRRGWYILTLKRFYLRCTFNKSIFKSWGMLKKGIATTLTLFLWHRLYKECLLWSPSTISAIWCRKARSKVNSSIPGRSGLSTKKVLIFLVSLRLNTNHSGNSGQRAPYNCWKIYLLFLSNVVWPCVILLRHSILLTSCYITD